MKKWYEGKTGNHQGLIIEEDTGKNIAVSYDKADAALISATPELLEACIFARECAEGPIPGMTLTAAIEKVCRLLDNAIAKAKGNQ